MSVLIIVLHGSREVPKAAGSPAGGVRALGHG